MAWIIFFKKRWLNRPSSFFFSFQSTSQMVCQPANGLFLTSKQKVLDANQSFVSALHQWAPACSFSVSIPNGRPSNIPASEAVQDVHQSKKKVFMILDYFLLSYLNKRLQWDRNRRLRLEVFHFSGVFKLWCCACDPVYIGEGFFRTLCSWHCKGRETNRRNRNATEGSENWWWAKIFEKRNGAAADEERATQEGKRACPWRYVPCSVTQTLPGATDRYNDTLCLPPFPHAQLLMSLIVSLLSVDHCPPLL